MEKKYWDTKTHRLYKQWNANMSALKVTSHPLFLPEQNVTKRNHEGQSHIQYIFIQR